VRIELPKAVSVAEDFKKHGMLCQLLNNYWHYEGTTIPWDVDNYLRVDTDWHPSRPESTAKTCLSFLATRKNTSKYL